MVLTMNIEAFTAMLVEKARAAGFEEYEVFAPLSESFQVRVFAGEIQEFKNAHNSGVAFRGRIGGRLGYASTERLDEESAGFVVEQARENASRIETHSEEPLHGGSPEYPEVASYEPRLDDVGTDEKCDITRRLEESALAADPRVISVDAALLGTAQGHTVIANSLGLDISHRTNIAYAYVMVRVQEGDKSAKVGFDSWAGRDLSALSVEELAGKAVAKAIAQIGATKPESGLFRVVLNNEAASDIFATFAPNFYAENAQKGFSLMAGMQGQRVACDKLSIRDDGYIDGTSGAALGSKPFDYEGVPTKNKAVVENGILKTLLHNLKSAKKDGVDPTGNGVRRGLGGSVTTGCGIFYVEPSSLGFEEVLAAAGEGILVTSLMGLHAGANVVSGEFSLQAGGFLIKDGKIGDPLEQMVVSGNFYSLMNDIIEVGGDIRFDIPSTEGTFGAPSILVSSLPVAGV